MTDKLMAETCKVLGDETRLKIVKMLKTSSRCACELLTQFNITQPTLSYHIKLLCDFGLVTFEKKGTWIHYSLSKNKLEEICNYLMHE